MIDRQIIRTAVLELNALDDTEVVKIAGILQKIKNWWQGFKNPEYREQVRQLKEESPAIQSLIDSLSTNIEDLQKAISSSNVEMYGESLERVRHLAGLLVNDLSKYEQKVSAIDEMTPTKEVEVPAREKEVRYTTRDTSKSKDVQEQLKAQLPSDYDLEFGRQRTPVSASQWMSRFSQSDVHFMPRPAQRIVTDLAKVMSRYLDLDENEALSVVGHDRKKLLDNVAEALMRGQINKVEFSKVSDEITHRPANQIKMYMSASDIPIPGTDIMFDIPNIVVVDLMASLRPSKKLSVYWTDHIRVSSRTNAALRTRALIRLAAKNIHQWARDILIQAFRQTMGRDPTLAELQLAQAVSWNESNYGRGWRANKNPDGRGPRSNNWGAVQSSMPKGGVCPANTFLYGDTHPTSSGTSVPYQVCFKVYPTPVDGASDVIRLLFKSKSRAPGIEEAARKGSISDFSSVMYDTHYYEGFGKTREQRIAGHAKGINRAVQTISKALGEESQFGEAVAGTTQDPMQKAVMNEYDQLIPMLLAASDEGPVEQMVKNAVLKSALPTTQVFIRISGKSFPAMVRFARITTMALREEFGAVSSIFEDGNSVEIESDIVGGAKNVLQASKALVAGITETFNDSFKTDIDTFVDIDQQSGKRVLTAKVTDDAFRKFAMVVMNGRP